MNAADRPVKAVRRPVTPEVLEEVLRRRAPEVYDAQRKAARPADEVMAELIAKHTPSPR